jgi:hypothetical protein
LLEKSLKFMLDLWILLLLLLKLLDLTVKPIPPRVSFFYKKTGCFGTLPFFMQLHTHFLAILVSSIFSAILDGSCQHSSICFHLQQIFLASRIFLSCLFIVIFIPAPFCHQTTTVSDPLHLMLNP